MATFNQEGQPVKNQINTGDGQLLKALERLASIEAFTLSGSIDPVRDRELLARIEFARNEIKKFKGDR